mgnify:CR=1 FL=1
MLSSVIQNIILLSLQKVSVYFCGVFSLQSWYNHFEGRSGNFVISGRVEDNRGEIKWFDPKVKGKVRIKLDGKFKVYYNEEEKEFDVLDLSFLYNWVVDKVNTSGEYQGLCQSSKRRGKIEVKVVEGKDVLQNLDTEKLNLLFVQIFGDVKILKAVVSSNRVYFQFYRRGVFWFSDLDRLVLKSHLSKELMELKNEVMSILNK